MPTPLADRNVIVYVDLVPLPAVCQPAWLRRKHGRTLLWADPTATRDSVMRFCLREMTSAEVVYLCAVYGPPEDHLNDFRRLIPVVPAILRIPSATSARARSA